MIFYVYEFFITSIYSYTYILCSGYKCDHWSIDISPLFNEEKQTVVVAHTHAHTNTIAYTIY